MRILRFISGILPLISFVSLLLDNKTKVWKSYFKYGRSMYVTNKYPQLLCIQRKSIIEYPFFFFIGIVWNSATYFSQTIEGISIKVPFTVSFSEEKLSIGQNDWLDMFFLSMQALSSKFLYSLYSTMCFELPCQICIEFVSLYVENINIKNVKNRPGIY